MVKTIRIFIAVLCSCALALTTTTFASNKKLSPRRNISSSARGGALRPAERSVQRRATLRAKAADCPLCQVMVDSGYVNPCSLRKMVKDGLVRDASGKKISKIWIIDARPGINSPCSDKDTYYVGSPRTKVVVMNMNPFAFDYEITKEEKNVPETAQITFLKLLGTPLSDAIGNQGEAGKAAGGDALRDETKAEGATCAGDIAKAETFLDAPFILDENLPAQNFAAWMKDLTTAFDTMRTRYERARKAYIALLDRWATCEELCENMDSFKDNYDKFDKYEFENVALKLLQIRQRLEGDFKARFPNIENCPGFAGSKLQAKLKNMRRQVEIQLDKLRILCNSMYSPDNSAKLASMREAIDTVLAHPDLLLMQTFDVGGYPDATRVKVTVEAKPKTLTQTLPPVVGTAPQPCDEAGGNGGNDQQSGGGSPPKQPIVTKQKPSPSPSPSPSP